MSEIVAVVAVFAALVGAGLNAIRAWYQAPEDEKFSWRKFSGGLVSGGLSAVAVVSFLELNVEAVGGYVALIVSHILLGVGASTLVAKAHE
jgi:hypothetical protein